MNIINKTKMILVILALFVSIPAFSLDFIAGVKSGYYAWEPYLKDINANSFNKIDRGKGMLVGPVASFLFTESLSVSLAALYGTQSTHWSTRDSYSAEDNKYFTGAGYFEARRLDVDAVISYSIISNLKLFAGFKYQNIESKLRFSEVRTSPLNTLSDIDNSYYIAETPSMGPALGVGVSYPFYDWFFAAANISGLYMKGKFNIDNKWTKRYEGFPSYTLEVSNDMKVEFDTVQYGINIEPSIGVLAKDLNLVFTLGFRYQYLKTDVKDAEEVIGKTTLNDTIYGVFISVLYSF